MSGCILIGMRGVQIRKFIHLKKNGWLLLQSSPSGLVVVVCSCSRLLGGALVAMRNLVRPALSTLFGGELKPLAPSHSTVYDVAGTVYDAGVGVGTTLSMMSWNLLAPCYKRPAEVSPDARILAQTAVVRASQADIVNLQEFWLEPSHLRTWRSVAAEEGYCMLVSPRSGGKRDGCCMLVRRTLLCAAPEVEALSYNDWGDRVVQLVTLRQAPALTLT